MGRIAVLFLCCSLSAAGDPPPWVAEAAAELTTAAEKYKADDDQGLLEVLDATWTRVVAERGKVRSRDALNPLMDVLQVLEAMPGAPLRAKTWRVAAAACHPKGIAMLQRGLARKDGAAPLAAAVRDSRCGQAHTWLLEHAAKSWAKDKAARKETRDALAACAGALSGTGLNDGSTSVVKSLQRAWRKALGSARGEFLDALLTALAETAGPPARAELLRWLKKQKSLDSERHMRLVAAVGKTGDPAGVAVLLFRVESTPGDLLEATLVALFNLPEATLRAQGRDILRATHAALEGEGKGKRRRTYDQTRYQAWWTAKIVDTPPQPLPAGAGTTGIHALWWRVIDAKPRGIKPPRASKRTRPQMLNNRPNLAPDEWNAWHRRHR